jgi:hypothetical protein
MKYIFLSILLLLIANSFKAQTNDFGIWTSVEGDKKLGKWNIGAEAILRTRNNSEDVKRWGLKVEVSRKIITLLKIGLSYQYISFNDLKYNDYQSRQRYAFFLSGKQKIGNFSISIREQVQRTIKDESDRIKANGNYDTYKINPEYIWRNRLQLSYNIPHFRVTPSLSFESFYQLNNPDGNVFCDLRYTLSFEYKITKHHQIELYGLINKEINVNDPVQSNVLGIGYSFSF